MSSQYTRRRFLEGIGTVSAVGSLGALAPAAWAKESADNWPQRSVRVIVPFNAGGGTDIIGRNLCEMLSKKLGQPFIVENRPGAGGIMGTAAAAKAAPDGYTWLFSLSTTLLLNQLLYSDLSYNPQKDLTMVSQISISPLVLLVHPGVAAGNFQELQAWLKENKGKVSYGSYGAGSVSHLTSAYLSKSTGAEMVHVSYQGEAPMLSDLIAGNVQLGIGSALASKPYIESGRLKAIGCTGTQRVGILPSVPTLAEQGATDRAYTIMGWMAMAAPAGVPEPVIQRMVDSLAEAAKDPAIKERMESLGVVPLFNTPQEFQANYQRDLPEWKSLVEVADAKVN